MRKRCNPCNPYCFEGGRNMIISNDCFFAEVVQRLEAGQSVRFRVKGTSMTPLLRDGKEEVVVYPCTTGSPKCWDVVLFRYHGHYVLHRIIRCTGSSFVLQGDGVWASHEECRMENVAGVVRQVVRPSGKVVCTSSLAWRWKSRLWCRLGPLRRFALRLF